MTGRALFRYSGAADVLPSHAKHSGQVVSIVRPLTAGEADLEEVGPMFRIRADDGWEGDVFGDELTEVAQ